MRRSETRETQESSPAPARARALGRSARWPSPKSRDLPEETFNAFSLFMSEWNWTPVFNKWLARMSLKGLVRHYCFYLTYFCLQSLLNVDWPWNLKKKKKSTSFHVVKHVTFSVKLKKYIFLNVLQRTTESRTRAGETKEPRRKLERSAITAGHYVMAFFSVFFLPSSHHSS